jgi:hypothetical protein
MGNSLQSNMQNATQDMTRDMQNQGYQQYQQSNPASQFVAPNIDYRTQRAGGSPQVGKGQGTGQPQFGQPNSYVSPTDGMGGGSNTPQVSQGQYGNTIQPWDNAQIGPKPSGKGGGSSGKGGAPAPQGKGGF